jgi:DNA-directed RNA polymerase specialized sigma24 family protein
MDGQVASSQIDALLLPYLQAAQESEAERLLTTLVSEHIEPVIKRTLRSKLGSRSPQGLSASDTDFEDLYSQVLVRLLTRLKECKGRPGEKAIVDLKGYVAVVSYHTCYEYFRLKYPHRHHLKNRVRYLLSHQPGLALWEGEDGELLGGLAAWKGRPAARGEGLRRLLESPCDLLPVGESKAVEQALVIFKETGHPVELDDLVGIFAELWGVKDRAAQTAADEGADPLARLADPRSDAARKVDHRFFLKWLWEEIGQLPVRQRRALLLNLRDEHGDCAAALLPSTGVASLRQIAAALEMSAEEFARLWPDLPLDDARLADLLGATRQQVINLRKCARERLARKMNALETRK